MPPKCKINLMFIDPLVICRLLNTYLNSLTYAYNMIYSVALKKTLSLFINEKISFMKWSAYSAQGHS